MASINEVLKMIEREDMFPAIKRKTYSFDAETALKCVYSVGTRICPSFTLDDANTPVYSALVAWLMGNPFKAKDPYKKVDIDADLTKGIYLYGNTGTGKSVAMDVLKALSLFDNPTYQAGKQSFPLAWSKVKASAICDSFLKTGDITPYQDVRVLLIDDFGSEPNEVLYMGNRCNPVQLVIEARGDKRGLFTLITSNIPLGTFKGGNPIEERYGARAESRLIQMCNYIYLGGCDRRKGTPDTLFNQ